MKVTGPPGWRASYTTFTETLSPLQDVVCLIDHRSCDIHSSTRGKRFKHATITRKPVLKAQHKFERAKRGKPLQRRVTPPKQAPKTEEKSDKVQMPQKKPNERQPSLEPPPNGHYELNPLMTRVLEKELQDIMIKVWQELPDDPSQKSEKLVVNKFKNKAGDDLLNVLGLNVTKRLLNVHNPLYVKVHFTKRPERDHLKAFLLKYRCIKFERVDAAAKTFTALMKNIQDFDKICSVKSIRIGSIKVYISPNYEFSKCPPNLKTNFNDKGGDNDKESEDIIEIKLSDTNTDNNKDQNIDNTSKLSEKGNTEKIEVKLETKKSQEIKVQVAQSQKRTETNATSKNVVNAVITVNKPTETKPTSVEPTKSKVSDNATPNKTVATKSDEAKTTIEMAKPKEQRTKTNEISNVKPSNPNDKTPIKLEETKTTKPVNNTPKLVVKTPVKMEENVKPVVKALVKPPVKMEEIVKPVDKAPKLVVKTPVKIEETVKAADKAPKPVVKTPNKIQETSSSKDAAPTPTKVEETVKTRTAVNPSNKPGEVKAIKIQKEIPKRVVQKTGSNPSKVINKAKASPKSQKDPVKVDNRNKVKKKSETMRILEEGDDYDVLDDDDILALISGGVILDECSGSDDD